MFDAYAAQRAVIDRHDLDVTHVGPQSGPGMPEWGMLLIPTKLVKQGEHDMVRISARG